MSRDITLLHPELQAIIEKFLIECKKQSLPVLITDTWRTKDEQDKLYAQGRTVSGSIVTNSKYPKSAHCWGVAFDFCRNLKGKEYDDGDGFFKKIGTIGKGLGLAWGGDWKDFVDKPHLEVIKYLPGSSVATLEKTYGLPEKFKAVWPKNMVNIDDNDEEELEVRYDSISDIPNYAKATIQKLIYHGFLAGTATGKLDLSEDMLRILVINDRTGIYDKK